jgi:hypothetical protein
MINRYQEMPIDNGECQKGNKFDQLGLFSVIFNSPASFK